MNFSVAMSSDTNAALLSHLLRSDHQEDLCFALWYPSAGRDRTTALIREPILPLDGEREVDGNVSFQPGYFERALALAISKKCGLGFLHSHLGPGWQWMSRYDIKAEIKHAAAVKAATQLPFVGLTVGTDGAWSARFWQKTSPKSYARNWCETVRVIGEQGLRVTFADHLIPAPRFREELRRTVSAWGTSAQAKLARLRFGIIGVGSVGSIIAESLARMGIQEIWLVDFDTVELLNLDRHLHATRKHVGYFNTRVTAEVLREVATAQDFSVHEVTFGITEEEGFRAALDCDVLFSCVDRPWPRAVLNFIAYAHLIPVVDGGILARQKENGTILSADWKAHIACPSRRCLECLGQYDSAHVQAEREGCLDDPEYINSLPKGHRLRRNENVFAFSASLASMQVFQILSMVISPLGVSNPGEWNFHFVTGALDRTSGERCHENCPYPQIQGMGDRSGYEVTARHRRADWSLDISRWTRNGRRVKMRASGTDSRPGPHAHGR